MSEALTVYAPGKAIVCGEYAVLDGAPAICIAVERYVSARAAMPGESVQTSPFVEEALKQAKATTHDPGPIEALQTSGVYVDSSALYERVGNGSTKLGLGSSAAVTAAVVGLARLTAGESLAKLSMIAAVANGAHSAAQGVAGSGIDVATSVYGGAVLFHRKGDATFIEAVAWPSSLKLTFVFSGQSASTPVLVSRVKALAARDHATYESRIAALTAISTRFVDDIQRGDADAAIATLATWQPTLASLAHAADAPIVTPVFERLYAIATEHGAASKPSGAGGGDLAVIVSRADRTAALEAALVAAGFSPIDLVPNGPAKGLHPGKHP